MLRTSGGILYTGYTNNIEKRIRMHKQGKGSKYMRAFSSFELVYTEEYDTKSDALRREEEIKKMSKKQKEELVSSYI